MNGAKRSRRHEGDDSVTAWPIDGVLDLHLFRPSEVRNLVRDYLEECQRAGILQVRIIHGKGKGTLRRIVHGELERSELVASYRLGGPGGWGSTQVELVAPERQGPSKNDR